MKGVALHLLGGELGNLSRRRDGLALCPAPGEDLARWLDAHNEQWVRSARFLGNGVLVELLDFAGATFERYLATLDLDARVGHVAWAGEGPVPLWLDVARELTERWVHQQQIRDAVGQPGAREPELVHAVLATFVHALPVTYRDVEAPEGTPVELRVDGPGGGAWHLVRKAAGWELSPGSHPAPQAVATVDVDDAWRLFTRNPDAREPRLEGDVELARPMRSAVAIVA